MMKCQAEGSKAGVVGLTGVPRQETDASASGMGAALEARAQPAVHNFIRRPTWRRLSISLSHLCRLIQCVTRSRPSRRG